MRGRLNIFQRTMLQWDDMHPYNAVGLVRVEGRFDQDRMKVSLKLALQRYGLGKFAVDDRIRAYEYLPAGDDPAVEVIAGHGDTAERVQSELELQLNRRFVRYEGPGTPLKPFNAFRFFAVEGEGFYYFGIVCFHAIADGYSLSLLIRDVFGHYFGEPGAAEGAVPDLYPATYLELFRKKPLLRFLRALSLPAFLTGLRRACKPYAMYHYHDLGVECRFLTCDPSVAPGLKRAAAAWGVTQHDIFLAIVFRAIAPFVAAKKVRDSKTTIALGSVINISRDLGVRQTGAFGVFLSSFAVSHPAPAGRSLESLAKEIQEKTAGIKKKRKYLVTLLEQWLALKLMPLLSREQQLKFYPKNYPLWAGVTNMNFGRSYDDIGGKIDLSALVSTGPNCPIVFAVTRVRTKLSVGITYRREVFSRDEIEKISSAFLAHAGEISSGV